MIKPMIPALLLALAWSVSVPASAESLATSASSAGLSASSAGSASLRGSSDSISGSSGGGERKESSVTDGDYRVASIDSIDGKADGLSLTLVPVAGGDDQGFRLALPQRALGERPLAVGDQVRAQRRPYGLEFARVDTRQPFFLVLADAWQRDLQTRVVGR